MPDIKTVTDAAVEAQIKAILGAWGMEEPALSITARVLLWADLRGIDSHGISMIASSYRRMRDAGVLNFPPAVAVRNPTHYGAAGYYAVMAAEAGLIGISMPGVHVAATVPTFGAEPRFGTNPIAFAAPAGRNPPFVLDMATSTVAIGQLVLAARAGKQLPAGRAPHDQGRELTDPQRARELRRLTPLGGTRDLGSHKGYGLAMMVDI